MLRDLILAAVRTGVAGAVGLAITWLINLGVEVPAELRGDVPAEEPASEESAVGVG